MRRLTGDQRSPPATRSGCNRRLERFLNRAPAQPGGGSLQR